MGWDVELRPDGIVVCGYPFPGASVHPDGLVAESLVRDADDTAWIPELRLESGETVFVPPHSAADLKSWCRRNGVPRRRRPDLWAALLSPFLLRDDDPEGCADPGPDAAATALLREHGVDDDEIRVVRSRFAAPMRAYNSVLRSHVHLGLPDLLWALQGGLVGEAHAVDPEEYVEIHRWALALADRSRRSSVWVV